MTTDRNRVWVPERQIVVPEQDLRLRVLSYNIQVGLDTAHYGHYVTRAWRHALPGRSMHYNLDRTAELLSQYDFVAIQEADAGSVRTRNINQMEYLAKRAGFSHWGLTITRDLRPLAQHCLGFLSRLPPTEVDEHVLPTRIPGRSAMRVRLGREGGGLTLVVTHLSLGARDQRRQLEFLGSLIPKGGPALVMGDLNCEPRALLRHGAVQRSGLWVPDPAPYTFPSWRPQRSLDHIMVSPGIDVHRIEALPHAVSDHLPLSAEISVRTTPA